MCFLLQKQSADIDSLRIHKLATRGVKFWAEMDQKIFSLDKAKRVPELKKMRDYVCYVALLLLLCMPSLSGWKNALILSIYLDHPEAERGFSKGLVRPKFCREGGRTRGHDLWRGR